MAKNYDYFYKEINEAKANVLIKYFGVQPHHTVVDIGSGTGFLAERLFERSELKTPVWCVDPSAEMQEEAKKKKGVFPVQKNADEFLDEFPQISTSTEWRVMLQLAILPMLWKSTRV